MNEQEKRLLAAILTAGRVQAEHDDRDLITRFIDVLREVAKREAEINTASRGK